MSATIGTSFCRACSKSLHRRLRHVIRSSVPASSRTNADACKETSASPSPHVAGINVAASNPRGLTMRHSQTRVMIRLPCRAEWVLNTISETVINICEVGGSTSYLVPPTFIFVEVCNTAAATFCSCVFYSFVLSGCWEGARWGEPHTRSPHIPGRMPFPCACAFS